MSHELLFKPIKIGKLTVKNRLVMPPMVRNYADEKGLVTPRYVAHIERIARGGVGMMVLEASFIVPGGRGFKNELGIDDDRVIPGLRKLVKAAHKHKAVIGPQLYHAGRQTTAAVCGQQPVAPSAIPDPSSNEMPRELTEKEIQTLVGQYAQAAARAKKAGCDFVEIHAAHGYLITQFLSPFSNRRRDQYGGPFLRRFQFLKEVLTHVRRAVGHDFPILVRLSGEENVPGGLEITDTIDVVHALQIHGADAVHVSTGNYASYPQGKMIPPMAVEDGPLLTLASAVKKSTRLPVIAVAKLRTPELAERVLHEGTADMIAIGRTLLADPDWPIKVQTGKVDTINPCIACNQGCISRLFAQQDVWCTVNPETGREQAFAKRSKGKKRVVVVGGGPAGMEAARVAAERGHEVILYEKTDRLGGQLFAAGVAPHREEWERLRQTLIHTINRLGVHVNLKTEFRPELAEQVSADAVIIAVGSAPVRPKIPGIGRTNVVTARDLLEGTAEVKGKVVIVGGGCSGAQTAEYTADQGFRTTIIEATGDIAADAPVDDRSLLLGRLADKKIDIMRETRLMAVGSGTVVVEDHTGTKSLPADTVVLCLGSSPNDGLLRELKPLVKKVFLVGDALQARRVTEAIAEGALAALSI